MRMGCWEDALAARSKLEGLLEAGHLWLVNQPRDVVILGLSLSYSVGVMGGRGDVLGVSAAGGEGVHVCVPSSVVSVVLGQEEVLLAAQWGTGCVCVLSFFGRV